MLPPGVVWHPLSCIFSENAPLIPDSLNSMCVTRDPALSAMLDANSKTSVYLCISMYGITKADERTLLGDPKHPTPPPGTCGSSQRPSSAFCRQVSG
jgi:hypothetical protein